MPNFVDITTVLAQRALVNLDHVIFATIHEGTIRLVLVDGSIVESTKSIPALGLTLDEESDDGR